MPRNYPLTPEQKAAYNAQRRETRRLKAAIAAELTPTQAKLRRCLVCDKPFNSTGPSHRICPRCKSERKIHLPGPVDWCGV